MSWKIPHFDSGGKQNRESLRKAQHASAGIQTQAPGCRADPLTRTPGGSLFSWPVLSLPPVPQGHITRSSQSPERLRLASVLGKWQLTYQSIEQTQCSFKILLYYCVPDASYRQAHLVIRAAQWGWNYYCPHFTKGEVQAQRGQATCLRAHSWNL